MAYILFELYFAYVISMADTDWLKILKMGADYYITIYVQS